MENYSTYFKNLLFDRYNKIIMELPTILISIFLFLTLWNFFGPVNVIIPPFITLFFKTKYLQLFNSKELIKSYLTLVIIAVLSFGATLNLPLCIILNFFVPFFIVYLLMDKFTPKAYFVYGMAFVFFQIMPIKIDQLPLRLLALTYSFIIVFFTLYLYSKYRANKNKKNIISEKLSLLSIFLEKVIKHQDNQKEKILLLNSIPQLNQIIYSYHTYKYFDNKFNKIFYWTMVLIERTFYLINTIEEKNIRYNNSEIRFLIKLNVILKKIAQNFENPLILSGLKGELSHFTKLLKNSKNKNLEDLYRLTTILDLIINENLTPSKAKTSNSWYFSNGANKFKHMTKLDLFQTRFALRLGTILSIGFTFYHYTEFNHAYWLPMSAFLMLMPYSEESKSKINNRILGTIGGIILCWILLSLFNSMNYRIIIIIFMTIMMYSTPITSWKMTVYTTCYGLTLATLSLKLESALVLRAIYVTIAVILVYLANNFLLPNTIKDEFKKSLKEYFEIDKKMIEEIKKNLKNSSNLNTFSELLIYHNLLTKEIETYINQNNTLENDNLKRILTFNHKLVLEMEQLNSYIYHYNKNGNLTDSTIVKIIIDNIDNAIQKSYQSCSNNQLNDYLNFEKNTIYSGVLEEEMYFNALAFNCMKNIVEIDKLYDKIISK